MNYKAYGNTKSTPSRMARKRARRDVYVFNRKAKKLMRKQRAKDSLGSES